jgi:hypothetical protein
MMPNQSDPRIERFLKKIEDWPDLSLTAAKPAIQDALLFLHGSIPEYPPTLPDQVYVRTGTLGRKITEQVSTDDVSVTGALGMNTPYAPWTVGPTFPGEEINGKTMYQAQVHVERWWQFYTVMDENMDGAREAFTDKFFERFHELVVQQVGGA